MEEKKESGSRIKEQKAASIKSSESKDVGKKVTAKTNKESSSEEEESSEEESDEEGDSETSEESEEEEKKTKSAPKTERVIEKDKEDEIEIEDLHSELQQLKRQRPADDKYKQKNRTERRHRRDESSYRKREQELLDDRGYKERKVSDKEKDLKYESHRGRSHRNDDAKSRSYEKSISEDRSRDKHKSSGNAKDVSKVKLDRTGSREKYSEVDVDKRRKSSRKDSGKTKSPEEGSRTASKGKDRKDRSESRKKATSEKVDKDNRGSNDVSSSKSKKDEGLSLILTERERRQFSNEIVDIDSEGSSNESEAVAPHSDAEMKQDQLFDGEEEKKDEAKLPPYYPAVRGCRNVEEFQWLNRIEEGTYGVVYRAKDKRTGLVIFMPSYLVH